VEDLVTRKLPDGLDGSMVKQGCPSCGRYGRVRRTLTRTDGTWRRMECVTCGVYHTCATDEGVTVHRKMKSIKPIDLFGEDDAA
jgi:hypothetical protein